MTEDQQRPQETPRRIVTAMVELMRVQGYAATGVKQLADAAGAPIGSIYHHFPGGKRDVAAAALRSAGQAYAELVGGLLTAPGDLPTVLRDAFAAAADDVETSGWINLCPVGSVAGEVADVDEELRRVVAEVIGAWIDGGGAVLAERGLTPQDARALVHVVVASLEGGFVMARTLRSAEPLRAAGEAMAAYATTLLARSPARGA